MPSEDPEVSRRKREKYRKRVMAELDADADDKRHGTILGYTVGCRCLPCTLARRFYMQEWRDRRKAEGR